MPIISNCEIWFLRADPKRPNAKYNPKNPTWEVQIRTQSKEVKKNWEALGLSVKAVIPDDGSKPYFKANIKKKSIKEADKQPSTPVGVVNGRGMPIDPNTVGNGSIANIRVFQYNYTQGGKEGVANVLMALQIVKHVVREVRPREDDFADCETETVMPEPSESDEDLGNDDTSMGQSAPAPTPTPRAPGQSSTRDF